MEKLTKKQDEILDCIKEFIADHGFPPTVREICRIKNLSSPSTVQMHLNSLVDKGYIKKDKIKNRTIELLVENEYINKKNSIIKVPFINNDKTEFINIPSSIISKNEELFAYLVKNDNLIECNIFKNDIVIIEKTKKINNNDIVAFIDGSKIYLNKYEKNDNVIGKVIGLYRKI